MALLDQLVVGIDGSDSSQRALQWAAAISSEITALHAFSPAEQLFAAALQIDLDPTRSEHQRLLENDWTHLPESPNIHLTKKLVDDYPAKALLKASNQNESIPIVIGQQGHSRWAADHVGDVANRLIHLANVPLIMINQTVTPTPLGPIAVYIHGNPDPNDSSIKWGIQLAEDYKLPIEVLNTPTSLLNKKITKKPPNQTPLKTFLEQINNENPNLAISAQTLEGHPVEALSNHLTKNETKLAILGTHHHSNPIRLLTNGVARHLPPLVNCPVIAIPEQ